MSVEKNGRPMSCYDMKNITKVANKYQYLGTAT
ncbi:hypothetical protein MTBUT4_240006 [Magnetospirillum sp. UT-4]|nr:hypothetical protein MTBUT4_240006 [Magnetospirillum sp. UT-4]